MRDLALKVIAGGVDPNIQTEHSLSENKCVPFACELVGVALNLSEPTSTEHTFDVMVSDVDSDIDIQVADAFTQGIVYPDERVFLAQADRIGLRSNGETGTASTNATYAYILKPLSPRPAGEVWLDGQIMSTIEDVTNSQTKCVPFASKVTGWAGSFAAAVNAEVTISPYVNNADSGVTITVPDTSTGGFFKTNSELALKTGAGLYSRSDGAGSSGGANAVCWVLQPEITTIPAGWVYQPFAGGIDIGAAVAPDELVSPVNGKVRNLVVHSASIASHDTNFALRVNGSAPTGAPNYLFKADPLDESGQSLPIDNIHDIYVVEGDLVDVLSGGEMDAASNSVLGLWIEPLGGSI